MSPPFSPANIQPAPVGFAESGAGRKVKSPEPHGAVRLSGTARQNVKYT
jgi:hypothetical protein